MPHEVLIMVGGKYEHAGSVSPAHKAVLALGAFAVAGVALVKLQSAVQRWRRMHLKFDIPLEDILFVGWGGNSPDRVQKAERIP